MNKPIATMNNLKIVIMFGMIILILLGIRIAADIIVPFILALFIAVTLNPLVQKLSQLHIPRILAIIMLITIIIIIVIILATYLGASLNELTRTLPQYRSSLMSPLSYLQPWLQRVGIIISVDELIKYVDPNSAMTFITGLLTQLSSTMSSIFLLLLTVVFMLLEAPQLSWKLQQLMTNPNKGMKEIQRALNTISCYLTLKTIINLMIGLIIWGILKILNVRFSLAWGLLAFILNYIPNIGAVLATIPPIVQVLIFNGFYNALIVLVTYLIINLIFCYILEPRIMRCGLGLSTLAIFLSLIFWGWLLGAAGMLLSIPLTIFVKISLEQTERGKRIAVLLSDMSDIVKQ